MTQTDEQQSELLQQLQPSNDLFITHTPDLESKPKLEQKYHILKKKLKKQKEQNAKYELDMLELANLMDDIKFQTQQKLNNQSDTESKLRDLEVQLSRSQQNSKSLTIQINQLISDKELLQEKLQDKMTNASQQIDPELLEEIKELKEYKHEMNNLCEQLKIKMQRKKTKLIYMRETLDYKEQELQKKEIVLRKISQSQEESQKQLKQTALKLRQLEQTKLKDLKRKCSAQEDLIVQLQNRIKQYVGDAESSSQSPANRKGSMKRNITQNHRQIKEVDEVLESTGKEFFNSKPTINLHSLSNEDIHDKSSSYGRSNLLPEIGNQVKNKAPNGSIRSSVDKLPKAKKGNSHGPTYQDSYERQVDSFVSRLKDPVYKNNSNNMQGVFSINQNQSHIIADTRNEEVTYDQHSMAGRGTISSRDDKIRRILEGTEQYEKLLYFTPEKSQLPRKHQPFDVGKESRDQQFRNRNIINK
ncbi:UNKNOWN [Stylonychia lemnae]|uniref:Lebercilin domain-containing protein n=1 Tax=Stylonychia lemnae TaxID=5949 RepID=A0A078B7U5_STYLE|nr:UNKNOWN [Stylonychia lemnae]|eukprot:CDW89628.1 UNKNOWN [Stylonychia lemnae]